jgi:hypothetical protein
VVVFAERPQTPTSSTDTIAYQGRLADANGNPLTGTYNMVFKLYDVAASGTALWTETWSGGSAVQVNDGLFNVLLGSITPIPQNVIEENDTLWLGVRVGTDAEMVPRVQIGSVPYAVESLVVPDLSVTTEKLTDGAVTSAKLDVTEAYSYVATQENTTSPTWTTLPTPDSVSFSLDKTQWVNIHYGAITAVNPGYPAFISVVIDGTSTATDTTIEQWGGNITIQGIHRVQLSAGPHTISLQYHTHAGGTATYWRRRILVSALSQ